MDIIGRQVKRRFLPLFMYDRAMTAKLIVHADTQTADLYKDGALVKTYRVSTAKNGAGCAEGSFCTPTGKFRIAEKIGDGLPEGAVLKSRQPTGDVWQGEERDEDLILTRVLWLDGVEEHNRNSKDRYIYLHGTNQEDRLGTPASHGCVRFSNKDIIEVFGHLSEGAEVEIIYNSCPAPSRALKP